MSDRPPTRAAIYARSARYDTTAIDRQIVACTQYVHDRGYNTIDVYVDNGVPGTPNTVRPELADLLANIGQYGVIVVWRMDRLARSVLDFNAIVARAEYHGTQIETADGDTARVDARPVLRVIDGGDR